MNRTFRILMQLQMTVLLLPAILCIGCSQNLKVLDFQAEYQNACLPTYFTNGRKWDKKISIEAGVDNQEDVAISKSYVIKEDDFGRVRDIQYGHYVEKEVPSIYGIDKNNLAASASAWIDFKGFYSGLSMGASIPNARLYHRGFFMGVSHKFNYLVPALSFGRFSTNADIKARYYRNTPSHTDIEGSWGLDSTDQNQIIREDKLKAAIKLDMHGKVAPYISWSFSNIDFWGEADVLKRGSAVRDDAVYEESGIRTYDFGIGVIFEAISGLDLIFEPQYSRIRYDEYYSSYHFNYKFQISLKLD
jgi:hypothetical protein